MAANIAINLIVLGVSGILSIPAFANFGKTPEANKVTVNIGVGATNSSFLTPPGTNGPGGNPPSVELWDGQGKSLGRARSDDKVVDGGTISLTISGPDGGRSSTTPMYIQLVASGDDEVCVSWLTTTSAPSDGGDFRSWTAETAQFCGMPWYPSTAPFPSLEQLFQPPCFWMSNDGRFAEAFSARLFDFHFPGTSDKAGPANSTAKQWLENPDTLCRAPGRQQFYSNAGDCIPMYPSGESIIGKKDKDTGFDLDFDAIESSHTVSCSAAGVPFQCNVDLAPNLPADKKPCAGTSAAINIDPNLTLAPSITSELKSQLSFNLAGPAATRDGQGAAGGVVSSIPKLITEDGVGNMGGIVSEIPKDGVGNYGGMVSEIPNAPEKARARRSAGRSSLLQRRAEIEFPRATESVTTTTAETPIITEGPKSPSIKTQHVEHVPVKRHAPVLNRREETRTEKPHEWCQENQLVVSEYIGHSATEVCESESSWGPDFVSVTEGVFCDMCERRSYPLCSEKETGACFDMAMKQVKSIGSGRRGGIILEKKYNEVRHWK